MSKTDEKAFFRLFLEAYEKCFWKSMDTPISETESKYFSNDIQERTGLVISKKSIKEYSFYILNSNTAQQDLPSPAILDTLARYITNASKTDEVTRKKKETQFKYWQNYRDTFAKAISLKRRRRKPIFVFNFKIWDLIAILFLLTTIAIYLYRNYNISLDFFDIFTPFSNTR